VTPGEVSPTPPQPPTPPTPPQPPTPPVASGAPGPGDEVFSLEDVLSAVEASVELTRVPGAESLWEGPNVVLPGYRRLFGGQLLAQAIAAAALAGEAAGKIARSLHLVFLAEGRPDSPTRWSAEPLHGGRTFATCSVTARQGERLLAAGLVSLHVPDEAERVLEHSAAPVLVPPPEEVAAIGQLGAMAFETRPILSPEPLSRAVGPAGAPFWRGERDVSVPNNTPERGRSGGAGPPALDGLAIGPPELAVWMRAPRAPRAGASQLAHQELLAFASDLTMMVAAMRPHEGIGFGSPLVGATAVTSHTISFHRPARVDGWLLFVQESPAAAGGRAYIRGDWFDTAGTVVASCAQEVLIRVAESHG